MTTEAEVLHALDQLIVPGVNRSLVALNMVRQVAVASQDVKLELALTPLGPNLRQKLADQARDAVQGLGAPQVTIEITQPEPASFNHFHHIIAVMSGKGGVGKSLLASLVAIALKRQGQQVGILDADLTGPSIPLMFGLEGRPVGSDKGILPMCSRTGIQIMSINLLLPHEDDALMWRGPVIARTIIQFWQQVVWGNLDYLVIDLPPGTSDAPLTVLQSLPVNGVVMVFTPQSLAGMIVRKAAQMVHRLKVPIIGLVENMSYMVSSETGRPIEVFGKSRGQELSRSVDAPLLGTLPLDPRLAGLCDNGQVETYDSQPFQSLAHNLMAALPQAKEHHHGPTGAGHHH